MPACCSSMYIQILKHSFLLLASPQDEHHKHEEEEPGGMDLTLFNANLGLRPGDAMQPLDINTWEGEQEQQAHG
eukprot:scaffold267392_cov23-Tisochrysis_lutea.AAC.1